ncbi:MAG: hypothetical protein HDS11_05630 [Bacteroides sp.]|nr:hypothetical protein [Bacteroidales bacterium]MBD5317129.1 hypothetical protein [Bacteroides sp.]MBD5376606.1 hypothetical protein [Bacteroides sp.]
MKTISSSDIIFATVSMRGSLVAQLCISGIASFKEILARVRQAIGARVGLATLKLRNGSQGWTDSRTLVF